MILVLFPPKVNVPPVMLKSPPTTIAVISDTVTVPSVISSFLQTAFVPFVIEQALLIITVSSAVGVVVIILIPLFQVPPFQTVLTLVSCLAETKLLTASNSITMYLISLSI